MTLTLNMLLFLSIALFAIGAFGVLIRRNALLVLMCIELMLNAVNLAFITFSRSFAGTNQDAAAAQVFVLMIMGVAAAEAAVGIAIVVTIFRARGHVEVDELRELRG